MVETPVTDAKVPTTVEQQMRKLKTVIDSQLPGFGVGVIAYSQDANKKDHVYYVDSLPEAQTLAMLKEVVVKLEQMNKSAPIPTPTTKH